MIKIIANNAHDIILRRYPTKLWLAFFCLIVFVIIGNYLALFKTPIYYSLTCDRGWLNTINCELIECAFLKPNLRNQTIKNISTSPDILNNGRILLNVEADLLHNHIKNNYFPSHSFLGFSDIYIYRFRGQVINEVKQIKNFIYSQKKSKQLKITRKLFPLFYLSLLLLPTTILVGIFGILLQPITTYTFKFQENNLIVLEKSIFISYRKTHSIDRLTIASADKQKNSILLTTKTEEFYLFDYFQNPQQASQAINKLKQYIHTKKDIPKKNKSYVLFPLTLTLFPFSNLNQ